MIRTVLVGVKMRLGGRGVQEEGHSSRLIRNNAELLFGRSCNIRCRSCSETQTQRGVFMREKTDP